ncbi:MAG TPA: D-aminoacyl-tRNA deacylase [Vicinamibacterales bacterium]|jgi:D-tyrosyl-tRNA(Tyr) deacylase|nr:D-aminoacyl-tRNA deacylase [Vicinamibacterales bacterium]
MRAVVQRVAGARVRVGDRTIGEIGPGLLVLLGVADDDAPADVQYMVSKVRDLRIFDDDAGKMNRTVVETAGGVLVVSQFTLCGDVRKGRRPSFDSAAPPALARALYEDVVRDLRGSGLQVATGEFQARMAVELVNDGPVTILLDSKKLF